MGQKRVLSIDHPLIYRIRHSDQRGATWLDEDHGILWLLAVEKREAGSDDDAYEYFATLHRSGRLLPTKDDYLRDRVETADRMRRTVRSDLESVLMETRRSPGLAFEASLASMVPIRILTRRGGGLEEIWVAVATRDPDGRGVPPRLRDYIFATLEDLTRPAEWDWRSDWPTDTLHWFEIARLGIRAVGD